MCCLGKMPSERWDIKSHTWRAVEAVAIVTWLALAGKWSLGVITHSVLMASVWLALIYVFRQNKRRRVRTEESDITYIFSERPICCILLWSECHSMIWVLAEQRSSGGVERMETMNEWYKDCPKKLHKKGQSAFPVSLFNHCRCNMQPASPPSVLSRWFHNYSFKVHVMDLKSVWIWNMFVKGLCCSFPI